MDSNLYNIKFKNLNFHVQTWHSEVSGVTTKKNEKHVLKNLSGEFRKCDLSIIIGHSGCGKTSLLNVLTGYTRQNVTGSIIVEGVDNAVDMRRRMKYIMQNYTLHELITVQEAMHFASNLKLHSVSQTCRPFKIDSILEDLGLSEKSNCYTGHLSGGERKRLSIALELIDDPSLILIDEPTTHLDSSSSLQTVRVLRQLAKEGRTIVCTIHQPSRSMLEMFDHIYAISNGRCIYQGAINNLVEFLKEIESPCPENYNPSDYILELAEVENENYENQFVEKIENGLNENYRQVTVITNENELLRETRKSMLLLDCNYSTHGRPTFFTQLQQLLMRNYLISMRDKTLTLMRIVIHIVIASFIGAMYFGVGNRASDIFNIYKLLFFNIFILMFTAFSSLQTSFPVDLPIVRREHFNGWYSTTSYYLALTLIDIPIVFVTNFIYITIVYLMTDQPMEFARFSSYFIIIFLLSLASQGLGLISGSVMNVKFTLILGSFFMFPFVLFSNFFIHSKDTHQMWHWIFECSFIKHAFEGSMQAIFGFNRDKLICTEDDQFCQFTWPYKFLDFFQVTDTITSCCIKLCLFIFLFRIIAFLLIWLRLRIK